MKFTKFTAIAGLVLGLSAVSTASESPTFEANLSKFSYETNLTNSEEAQTKFDFGGDNVKVTTTWTLSGNTYILAEKDLYRQNLTGIFKGSYWYTSGVFGQEATRTEDWRTVAGLGVGVGVSKDNFFASAGVYGLFRVKDKPDVSLSGTFGFKF